MSLPCDHQHIYAAPDACAFAANHCQASSILNFNVFYYCTLDQNLPLFLPIGLFVILLCFYFLATTAGNYLSPGLARISKMLHMSQNLAGVTLLALGNGAPDVFSTVAATDNPDNGISMPVAAIIGSGFFVGNFVYALVILSSSSPIQVKAPSYLRDSLFYLISIMIIGIYSLVGYISLLMSLIFLFLYAVYLFLIGLNECKRMPRNRRKETQSLVERDILDETDEFENPFLEMQNQRPISEQVQSLSNSLSLSLSQRRKSADDEIEMEAWQKSELDLKPFDQNTFIFKGNNLQSSLIDSHIREATPRQLRKQSTKKRGKIAQGARNFKSSFMWSLVKAQYSMQRIAQSDIPWKERSCCQKCQSAIIDTPLDFIRRLTICGYDNESWSRCFAALVPLFGTLFIFLSTGLFEVNCGHIKLCWVVMPIMLVPSVVIYCTSHSSRAPRYARFFVYQTFMMSILWIWFVANILVDVLQLIGLITGVETAYLAITILALGNSVGDCMSDLAIAKMGLGELAITGCVAGPLFNLLLGLGISLLKITAEYGSISFSYKDKDNTLPLVSLLFLILVYIVQTSLVACKHFSIPRSLGWMPLIAFCFFLVLATLLTFAF